MAEAPLQPQPLPIDSLLPRLQEVLVPPGATLLLQAPPGAGKSGPAHGRRVRLRPG